VTRRIRITSISNERLKAVRRLRRRRGGVFVAEGHRQLRAALEAGAAVQEVFAAPELYLGDEDERLVASASRRGTRVYELSRAAFLSISGDVRPDGVLAVVARWRTSLDHLRPSSDALIVAVEGVERPGNLGTIVRTARAAGADALLVCDGRTDAFHPEVVRSSVGAIFSVPLAELSTADAVTALREMGTRIVVATPQADLVHWAPDYTGSNAIVLGSERHGVSDAWLDAADTTVSIPMAVGADSLNVAVAAGIVLFEAARQRTSAAKAAPAVS
jgi:RNA methyltransferase, TrmH family